MPALEWTTPTRRAGSKTLSALPAEIYLDIFEHLNLQKDETKRPDTRDFRSLAQVCRYFCAVMIPRIFEVVFIDGGAKDDDHSGTSFCRRICDGDEIALTAASHVKIFRLRRRYGDNWSDNEFLSLYAKAIDHMRNLEEIDFIRTSLTNRLLKTIVSLPGLKKLVLQSCGARKMRQQYLSQLLQLRLETLRVEDELGEDEEHSPSTKAFFSHLPLQNVANLKVLCPYILNQILSSTSLPNLQGFDVTSLLVDVNLHDILSKMPNLKRLVIDSLNSPSSDTTFPGALPNLPHLHELRAPMIILEKVIPGSAISSIEVSYRARSIFHYDKLSDPNEAEVKLLSQSRRPITSLSVPFSFYTATQFSVTFPALRSLAIEPSHPNYEYGNHVYFLRESIENLLSRFLESWPVHPPLYELTLVLLCMRPDNPELSRLGPSILHDLSRMIPTLRFCTTRYSSYSDIDTWFFCEETKLWRLMGGVTKSPW